ncbi:dTDP-4-dehydrorhamnose 3,5-epimerase [Bosea sp. (in: a-proteobacteria)]|uniref:dTDP-4-dehydrorhamnose 3,5-epimerase n=1 Tax=Bosea sp. (in: a-proteobacteria) TaxID=1871050 RepID=UPI003B3B72C5
MIFRSTPIPGAFVVDIEPRADDRGMFARTMCRDEFAKAGLPSDFVQMNISVNRRRNTLRGMHYQAEPHPEGKLVRCTRGAIFDAFVDLRPNSPTLGRWFGTELTQDNSRALYVPCGCAHGFQTLVDDSDVLYAMSESYHPDLARGVRWNDPAFAIRWPLSDPLMSERDASYPDFRV